MRLLTLTNVCVHIQCMTTLHIWGWHCQDIQCHRSAWHIWEWHCQDKQCHRTAWHIWGDIARTYSVIGRQSTFEGTLPGHTVSQDDITHLRLTLPGHTVSQDDMAYLRVTLQGHAVSRTTWHIWCWHCQDIQCHRTAWHIWGWDCQDIQCMTTWHIWGLHCQDVQCHRTTWHIWEDIARTYSVTGLHGTFEVDIARTNSVTGRHGTFEGDIARTNSVTGRHGTFEDYIARTNSVTGRHGTFEETLPGQTVSQDDMAHLRRHCQDMQCHRTTGHTWGWHCQETVKLLSSDITIDYIVNKSREGDISRIKVTLPWNNRTLLPSDDTYSTE